MLFRRSLLATTAALTSATLAGCTAVLGGETERRYVDVLNGSEEPHVFAVTVTNSAGETIFDREYDLGARNADENRIIEGAPAEVTVAVDDDDSVEFLWNQREDVGSSSEERQGGTATSLSIYYEQQSGRE